MEPADLTAWPTRGLAHTDFRQVAKNGFGDQHNAYPHSMELFDGKLYVGTSRSNMCMLRVSKMKTRIKHWPVQCPDDLYDLDMRAQIHRLDFDSGRWREVSRAPFIDGNPDPRIPREMSYRCMVVFQGESDEVPALYCGTYASARGDGAYILRSSDGENFLPTLRPESFGGSVITVRFLVAFKGRLFTSPAGVAGGNPNAAFRAVIYETRDPMRQPWVATSELGFGDPGNVSVLEMAAFGDHLYAGTLNYEGYQVWRTRAEGNPSLQVGLRGHAGCVAGQAQSVCFQPPRVQGCALCRRRDPAWRRRCRQPHWPCRSGAHTDPPRRQLGSSGRHGARHTSWLEDGAVGLSPRASAMSRTVTSGAWRRMTGGSIWAR